MTEKYFTSKGALSLIEKIIELYKVGIVTKKQEIVESQEYYFVLPKVDVYDINIKNYKFNFSEKYHTGAILNKNKKEFFDFRVQEGEDTGKSASLACLWRRFLERGKVTNRENSEDNVLIGNKEIFKGYTYLDILKSVFSSQAPDSHLKISDYIKVHFNEKLKKKYRHINSVDSSANESLKEIPLIFSIGVSVKDEYEDCEITKKQFEDVIDLEWAMTYLLITLGKLYKHIKAPSSEGEIRLYRVLYYKENKEVPTDVYSRGIEDTFVSTSVFAPYYREVCKQEFYFNADFEDFLCIFNYIVSPFKESLFCLVSGSDCEVEFGVLHVDKSFKKMFYDKDEENEKFLSDNINNYGPFLEKIKKKIVKDNWHIDTLKANIFCNLKSIIEYRKINKEKKNFEFLVPDYAKICIKVFEENEKSDKYELNSVNF